MSDREIVRVRDVMKPDFDMVDGMCTVAEALKAMEHIETKCLIIDKRHDDDEYGMLLITDIARKVLAKDKAPERVNVYEVMAKPVISVDPDMDIRYCARLFDQFRLTRCPVLDGSKKVVGIVSLSDLVYRGLVNGLK